MRERPRGGLMDRRSRRKAENNRSLHQVNEDYFLTPQRRDRIHEAASKFLG